MGDVVDHIDASNILLLEQMNRLAFLFTEYRNQNIGPRYFLASRGLHVKHGSLQDTLETQGGLSIAIRIPLR